MFEFLKKIFSKNKEVLQKDNQPLLINGSISFQESNEVNIAKEKLKEATQLKREKKYEEACQKLIEAYSFEGGEDLSIEDRLRLPMYLQLANKNDEGWRILNELNITYTDVFSQSKIANQMRVFLQKEKKYDQAVLYGIWTICKEIERDRSNIQDIINWTDGKGYELRQFYEENDILPSNTSKSDEIYGKTPKGNPINDSSFLLFNNRINETISIEGVKERIEPLLKKAKMNSKINDTSKAISDYLKSSNFYNFRELQIILASYVLDKE